ncbi:unnamed protein product [Sphagnum troendelagicum]|uniref:Actin-related protein 8 n=1 Tax=Sphagnum troendelagicum TaxID=128251 RepID=A0ABP0U455_9BRYO
MKKNPLGLGFRVTQSLLLKPDYYKSLPPSQLLDQRGSDIIVINPGSANVRIGHASSKAPITVPHCIAHHLWINDKKEGSAKRSSHKGAVGEKWVCALPNMITYDYLTEYMLFDSDVCTMGGDKFSLVPQNEDTFSWTQVEDESDLVMPATLKQSLSKSSPKGTPTALPNTHDVTENGMAMEEDKRSKPFRRYICGEDSLRIAADEPYCLHRPMCRGRLNVSTHYSLQQVCDDVYRIWDWILTEKFNLAAKSRRNLSAVIVVPDTLDSREVKELLMVVLRDLQFHSAVVFQECVAATFGNGVSSGCIVNMGAQVTSVMCIEEGVAIPTTRSVLSFGGDDITRCLLWVQQQRQTWPHIDSDPLHDPLDFQTLNNLKETHCLMREYEQRVATEIRCRTAGEPTRVYKVSLSALNVPAEGLFYPSLLAPEEYSALMRPWYHVDHEDVADDSLQEANKRNEAMEPGFVNGNLNGAYVSAGNAEGFPANSEENMRDRVEELSIGLQQCIVNSILSIGRMDLQKKLFASIQLVGGVALTKGLVDAIEERVLHTIPAHESVDTVEVLPNRIDPSTAMWRGGAVLAVLDSGRDLWVQYEDWMDGGVGVGTGRKYRDSNTLHSQAFWYNAMLD